MKFKHLLFVSFFFLGVPFAALAGYGQGGYYSQGGYYGQSYYQTYYQGGYTAQQIVNMRSNVDQCGHANNPSLLTCNNFADWSNPPNTLGTALVPGTAGAFIMRATNNSSGAAYALSSFCRAWGKQNTTSAAWTPQTCADGPSGGSLPTVAAGTPITLEYWNRARANIGYWNNCSWTCGDHMDWYFQNWLPNCSTNYGGSNSALTTLSGLTAQGYGVVGVSPVVTTTYTVSCSGGDPGNLSRSITVTVAAASSVTFSVSTPANYNTASTVNWSSSNVHSCSISGGNFGGGTAVATSGVGGSTGAQTASSINYTLSCLRDFDNSTIQSTVTVSVDQCTNVAGTQSGAPANGTMSGGVCSCNSGYTLSGASCLANASAPVTITLSATDPSANEPADTGTFTFTRTGSTVSALGITFNKTGTALTTSPATASNPANYSWAGGTCTSVTASSATIPAGLGSCTIVVTPIDDTIYETSGTVNTAVSASGPNPMTIIGSPPSPAGKVGQALQLNGTSQYAQNAAPTSVLHSDTGESMSAWIYPTTLAPAWQNVFWKGNTPECTTGCENREFTLWLNTNGSIHIYSTPVSGIGVSQIGCNTGASVITTGSWQHVAGTIDTANARVRIYINGTLNTTCAYDTSGIRTTTGPLIIGAQAGPGSLFNGFIDEVKFYNRELTSGEVSTLNSLGSVTSGMTGYWSFDTAQISGASALDASNIGSPSADIVTVNDNDTSGPTINGSGLQVNCTANGSPATTCKARKGGYAYLNWSVSGLAAGQSCAITSNPSMASLPSQAGSGGGITWNSTAGGQQTPSTVTAKTIFTLTCTGVTPSSATVSLVPVIKEQ